MSEEEEALQVTKAVSETLNKISTALSHIDNYGKRTRHITLALILSLIIDIGLTATVGVVASNSVATSSVVSSEVQTIHNVQVTNCAIANRTRLDEISLWHQFVAIATEPAPGQPPQTEAQKQHTRETINQLFSAVGKTFAPLSCPT